MQSRLIRIASVHYDPIDAAFHGMAIRRRPTGDLVSRPVRVSAPPYWDHMRAISALHEAAT